MVAATPFPESPEPADGPRREDRVGPAGRPALAATSPDPELVQARAERSLLRSVIVGAAIGAVVGAGVWAVLVLVALAGTDWDLGPPMWMGAGVGAFAGSFYGGWVGTMIGCRKLEEAEHLTLVSERGR